MLYPCPLPCVFLRKRVVSILEELGLWSRLRFQLQKPMSLQCPEQDYSRRCVPNEIVAVKFRRFRNWVSAFESEVMITISTGSRANVVLRQHQSDACGERAAARVCSPLSLSNRPDLKPLHTYMCIYSVRHIRL